MAEEAAKASNVRLFDVVDEVRYVRGSSYFDVDLAGRRILHIGENAFGRNRTGQILEATHELIHAQRYNNVLRGRGGNFVQAYNDYFLAKPFGSDLYALEEVTTEFLALRRVENYLGGLSPQQRGASIRYVNYWQARFLGNH
ncbi:MAG: hypothetical protein KatS3mg105_2046 [Gemmatales bacterium]|nr:MAG: hypothetical protein KatS3mg105_2046 [Gemmatales bacterium]